MSFLIPILFEVVSFNIRPCIPNIGAPLKQIAVGVTLESIRRELVLHKMLAHCLERHVQSTIMGCPSTFQITWPAVWYLVKLKCLLLDLDGSTTDWDFQFDNKRQIGAACFPHIWFQESFFSPVFDCWPISIGKSSERLVIEVNLDSTKRLSWLALLGDDGKPSFTVIKLPQRRHWRALSSNEAKILQHHGCHPHWNKGVNITKLEFDMSMFAFYIVVFADTAY